MAYLGQLDLADFNPKAPPPKTPAFWDCVDANRAPEDAELADILDRLGNPEAVTLVELSNGAKNDLGTEFHTWLRDRRNSRQIPHRLGAVGYVPVRNDAAKDGRWKIDGRRQVVYARYDLTPRDRLAAAHAKAVGVS